MERRRRETILNAAARAFARVGFKRAAVDDIARDAGVAKGTVYLACDSKEDLLYQVLHREVRALVAEVAKLIDPRSPAEELLASTADASVGLLERRPLARDLLVGRFHAVLPRWTGQLDELRALGRSNAVEVLRLGVRQRRFRSDLDVDAVAALLQDVLVAAWLVPADRPVDPVSAARARLAAAVPLLVDGIRARPRAQ